MAGVTDEAPRRNWCGTMPVHRRLLDSDPAYALAREAIENQTFDMGIGGPPRLESVVTIPVVVHVVWNQPEQNVSDEQIAGQLAVLNQDFRATNPDTASVPAVWRPLVADSRVAFTLAEVTRTQTSRTAFSTDDGVKAAATGGADPWPADRYLNLWVCQLSGGLLGYAQFPGGPPETDGVVVLHSGFGTTGSAAAPFDGGRTTTHEVGHWLNLRHIWGDDGDGCGGDDLVADTPNQAGPNHGKPTWPSVTCNNGPDGDMFMNYMDYTDDAAMFMFTAGQAARMAACLAGPRSGLSATAPPELVRRWVHVREEDRDGVEVYRPADRPLPPARGRDGIEFRPDGTFVDLKAGPVDAPVGGPGGRWRADPDGRLELTGPEGTSSGYDIVALDDDVLHLRPRPA
jgi:hypothetical protein